MAEEKPIIDIVNELFDENLNPMRKVMERVWFRNILYYLGEQWINWLVSLNTFRRKPTHPFVPTPVSNIIREYIRSMKAMILNRKMATRVWPNSKEEEDRQAAEMAENLLEWMDTENDGEFLDEKEKVTLWLGLTGTAFMRDFPMLDRGEFGIDTDGKIIKSGEVVSQAIIPFNVHVPDLGDSLRSKKMVGIKSLKEREWVEKTFKVKISGGSEEEAVNYQHRLMKMVSNVSPWKGSGLESQFMQIKTEDFVIFKEVEFRPTPKYPEGRYIIAVGKETIREHKRLPIPVVKGKWDYTLTDFHYNYCPGRFWSDSGVDDLISPQNIINEIDQALVLNRKGLGRPLVLTPSDMSMSAQNSWGQSILAIKYDAMLSGGKEPKIERGVSLPAQVLEERLVQREVAQDAAGDPKNILKGKAPTAKASGIMVDILREAAEQAHTPDVDRFYRSLTRSYKKRLILAQILYTEERMIKAKGKGNEIKVIAFKAADLRNNTDVRLELDSTMSTTKAGQTQLILQMGQYGFFGDLQTADPETRQEVLRRMGLGGFRHKTSVDVERAQAENMVIINGKDVSEIQILSVEEGQPQMAVEDPRFRYDDHPTHFEVHRRKILSPEFNSLPDSVRTVFLAHNDAHAFKMEENREAMMEEMQNIEAMAGEEKGGPEGGAGPPGGGEGAIGEEMGA